ncbi:Gfo/Idh/MocA family oxidoreductase [Chelativorans sp. Marseille-P2723]|uniref:Gfo/Idh/MocA family protein n=1 Tax=Chelativorans sp. Marseille-P2723 TaxID=2709133 RepID=UPI00156FE110|nr:Gfo/Idh/MocA family oxidoreductase [Chelativorans sp. Marseille-P2723]
MFRWGVLSTARIGRDHVIPQLLDSENGVLTAIASRDEKRARAFAERFGIGRDYSSYEALLASAEVDGVYIPLPTSQHVEWAVKAADAGKHVLVEKPLALKAEEIARVIEARDRNRVLISEAFMVIHHPQWTKVRELVEAGAIGRLRHVQAAFSYYNRDQWDMRNRPELGGGGLRDIGVYPIVTARFVTGKEPVRVQARVERDPAFGTDSYASVKADFDGFELSFYISTQMAARQVMVFHGDKGFIEVETPFNSRIYGDDRVILHDATHDVSTVHRFGDIRQYRLQAEAFVRAAQGADARVFTLEESLNNQRVIDAIYRATSHDGWEPVDASANIVP